MRQAAEAQLIEQFAYDFKFESFTPAVTCTTRK